MATSYNTKYLKSLQAIRERSQEVYERGQLGRLHHFELDESKIDEVADYVLSLVKRDFGSIAKVPPHGRWRSYKVIQDGEERDLITEHVAKWKGSDISEWEIGRRVIDLFMVSVLIDAGAGSRWKYRDAELGEFERTEGLGIAALRMFEAGVFSSSLTNPMQVDARALLALEDVDLVRGLQVSDENPLLGCENRAQLLRNLGQALDQGPVFFGGKCACNEHPARPGFLLDYLSSCAESPLYISVDDIWEVVIDGLAPVWPASRTQLGGVSLGDVWPCPVLARPLYSDDDGDEERNVQGAVCLVPFHKLSQWLTWSLLEVVVRLGGFTVKDTEKLTGLAEYRNGGVLVDMGVLTLKEADRQRGLANGTVVPTFEGSDAAIVEWRAMTVVLLDKVAEAVRQRSGLAESQIPDLFLARVLEGGTWKAGREIAARLRPETKDPPINIISDGTLF